jgi:hypothetical protein
MLAEIDAAFRVAPVVPENVSAHIIVQENANPPPPGFAPISSYIYRIRFTLTLFGASVVFRCTMPKFTANSATDCIASIVAPTTLSAEMRVWIERTFTADFIAKSMERIDESVSVRIRVNTETLSDQKIRHLHESVSRRKKNIHAMIIRHIKGVACITFG